MPAATTFGGWVTNRPVATGGSFSPIHLVGWIATAGAALTSVGTGGDVSLELLQRATARTQHVLPVREIAEAQPPLRTPREDLARIRETLSPAISDLASVFGVTRQSIYNWINGEAVAQANANKLRDLAQAADVLAHEGIAVRATLLKRAFSNNKTLLQVAQAGESARDAALMLVQIHKREAAQRERMNARTAQRGKSPATADFDLPASGNEA